MLGRASICIYTTRYSRESKSNLLSFLFSLQAFHGLDAAHYWGEPLALLSLPILDPSQTQPEIIFNQISGYPVTQSS